MRNTKHKQMMKRVVKSGEETGRDTENTQRIT